MHVVGGQQTSVLRTKGRQHEGELNRGSRWPGFSILREIAVDTSDELIAIAASLGDDEEVDLPYRGKTYRYPKSFFLLHALEHGVEHRTEIKLALALVGIPTPTLTDGSTAKPRDTVTNRDGHRSGGGYGNALLTEPMV